MIASAPALEEIQTRLFEIKDELARRAGSDVDFHDSLTRKPKATIEAAYSLPEGTLNELPIEIFETDAGALGFVLPPRPGSDTEELSEEQLEAVAGGVVTEAVVLAGITAVSAIVGSITAIGVAGASGDNGWGKK